MLVRVIKSYRDIVTICDSELLGKKFEEGNFQLDIKESFYLGDEVSEEEASIIVKKMKREDATFNIVGEKSIALAINENLISENNVKKIDGVPFSLVFL